MSITLVFAQITCCQQRATICHDLPSIVPVVTKMFRPRRSRSLLKTRRSRSVFRRIARPRRSTGIRMPGITIPRFRPASLSRLLFPGASLWGLFWKMPKASFRDKINGSASIVDGDTICRGGVGQFGFTGLMHLKLAKWLKELTGNGMTRVNS